MLPELLSSCRPACYGGEGHVLSSNVKLRPNCSLSDEVVDPLYRSMSILATEKEV